MRCCCSRGVHLPFATFGVYSLGRPRCALALVFRPVVGIRVLLALKRNSVDLPQFCPLLSELLERVDLLFLLAL